MDAYCGDCMKRFISGLHESAAGCIIFLLFKPFSLDRRFLVLCVDYCFTCF